VTLGACLTVPLSIGNLLGEKNADRAGVAANAAMLISIWLALFLRFACSFIDLLCMTVVQSGILVAFRVTWGYMFNDDPGMGYMTRILAKITHRIYFPQEVVTLVAAILPLVALAQVFDQCAAVLSGILRSRGKQVCQTVSDLVSNIPSNQKTVTRLDFGCDNQH